MSAGQIGNRASTKRLSDEEKYGFTEPEIIIAQRQLTTKGINASLLPPKEASKCFEMFIIGYTFTEISEQLGQDYPRLLFTAAYNKWFKLREENINQFKDRIKIKMAKTVMDQVDFISLLFEVNNIDNIKEMRAYIKDPRNAPKPQMRITSFKDYKDMIEMVNKMYTSAANMTTKTSEIINDLDFQTNTQKAGTKGVKVLEDGTEEELDNSETEEDIAKLIANNLGEEL